MTNPDELFGSTNIDIICNELHKTALSKGFWNKALNIPEKLALIHSEVSEALEQDRIGEPTNFSKIYYYGSRNKPEGVASELVDVIIRCMDLLQYFMDESKCPPLSQMIHEKNTFNKNRSYQHGKQY